MQNSRGFTLIELIMVIILIGVVSAAASSLFTRTSSFSAVAARDQMIAIATVAQKRALADSAATQSVFLRIIQTSGEWTLAVQKIRKPKAIKNKQRRRSITGQLK